MTFTSTFIDKISVSVVYAPLVTIALVFDGFVCGFWLCGNFFLRFWMIFSSVLWFLIYPNAPPPEISAWVAFYKMMLHLVDIKCSWMDLATACFTYIAFLTNLMFFNTSCCCFSSCCNCAFCSGCLLMAPRWKKVSQHWYGQFGRLCLSCQWQLL